MAEQARSKKPSPAEKPAGNPFPEPPNLSDRPAPFDSGGSDRLSRFGRDFTGIALGAFALLTLLALTGKAGGTWLLNWNRFLRLWLGQGAYLVAAAAGLGSIFALVHSVRPAKPWRLGRILALEGLGFTVLALLALFGGSLIERAENGLDGGLVGWGLVTLLDSLHLPDGFSSIILMVLFVYFLAASLGAGGALERWASRQISGQAKSPEEGLIPGLEDETPFQPPLLSIEAEEAGKKNRKKNVLPPQFRKSLKPEQTVEQPAGIPAQRDERLPPLNLLSAEQSLRPDERHINLTAGLIEKTLAEFGIPAKVVGYRVGPTVTQFAVEPGFIDKPGQNGDAQRQKVRVSQIQALSRDLTLALSAERLRIEAPVPGRSYVGIEVPNTRSFVVRLRPVLEADAFYKAASPLTFALGRDVSGQPVVADLARMPHLLIAGTTGSGKSVCIAAITASLVMNNAPEDLRLVMIDPKMVELVRFNGLPHMYGKVEVDLERIGNVLRWTMGEMDRRYKLLEEARARDIVAYNHKMEKRKQPTLPRVVVIIDELADLMMTAPEQTEGSLVRLAQLARATGIHLVVATQRPSTDVVTGLIKANFPARISFAVASSVDSRVILDTQGAETLLGRGDMLFMNPESGTPQRAQGVMITDQEIERIIAFWQKMSPSAGGEAPWEKMVTDGEERGDDLVEQAIEVVRGLNRASASMLQRRLRIGYPRAARLMDELEERGIVGPSQGGGRDREVLIDDEEGSEEDEDR